MSDEEVYKRSSALLEEGVDSNPVKQFSAWYNDAIAAKPGDWFLPEAMTLSTASTDGTVSARIVLLKEVEDDGFVFYTNYESDKGKQLLENEKASLVFYWPYLARQVRIEGVVSRVSRNESERYFNTRPRASQVGALASDQSRIIENREALDERFDELDRQYQNREIPLPDYWGGYSLLPVNFEFWQGRDSRLHDRLRYIKLKNGEWKIQRLAP